VARGTGTAVVTATGMRTELGHIAHLLTSAEATEPPLQRRLARVMRTLLFACAGIVLVVALLGLSIPRADGVLCVKGPGSGQAAAPLASSAQGA